MPNHPHRVDQIWNKLGILRGVILIIFTSILFMAMMVLMAVVSFIDMMAHIIRSLVRREHDVHEKFNGDGDRSNGAGGVQ